MVKYFISSSEEIVSESNIGNQFGNHFNFCNFLNYYTFILKFEDLIIIQI